jgi:hypothetical protein
MVRTLLQSCHAKVCDLNSAFTVQQYVLWLEISVADIVGVTVAHATHDLSEKEDSIFFGYGPTSVNEVKEITIFDILKE